MRYTKKVQNITSIFETNRDKLFAYLVRMTGDVDQAHDILQETIMRYMEHYGEKENSSALLFTIARNVLIDHTRKHRYHVELDGEHKDHAEDLEKTLLIRENYRRVMKGFEALDEEERDILSMVVSSDLSYREIAVIAGMSVANVKVKVHRARVKLRTMFAGEES